MDGAAVIVGRADIDSSVPSEHRSYGAQSMIASLRRALVHLPDSEFTPENLEAYGLDPLPALEPALEEQRTFIAALEARGVEIEYLEEHAGVQCSATYDPALVTNAGAVMMTSGRPERRSETFPMARKFLELDIPVIGWIKDGGCMDAGDTLWLDDDTLLVGRSYRSNDEGYRQLRHILDGVVTSFHHYEMPHWRGASEVLHLMSVVSLVDKDVAVVYPKAMPIRLLELLQEREYRLIEVPGNEYENLAANVLALEPGVAMMVAGNPSTSAALRDAGIEVIEYPGEHISVRRLSGPTCNARPLLRV